MKMLLNSSKIAFFTIFWELRECRFSCGKQPEVSIALVDHLHPNDMGGNDKWNLTHNPAGYSQVTTQPMSRLMVHKGYMFKLWLQLFQEWRSLLEKRRKVFKNLANSGCSQRSSFGWGRWLSRKPDAGLDAHGLTLQFSRPVISFYFF